MKEEKAMFGVKNEWAFEGEDDFVWFDSLDEMMTWLEMFEIFSLDELIPLGDNLWAME